MHTGLGDGALFSESILEVSVWLKVLFIVRLSFYPKFFVSPAYVGRSVRRGFNFPKASGGRRSHSHRSKSIEVPSTSADGRMFVRVEQPSNGSNIVG